MLAGHTKPTENRCPTFEVTAVDNLQRISSLSVNFYLVTLLKRYPSEKQTRTKLEQNMDISRYSNTVIRCADCTLAHFLAQICIFRRKISFTGCLLTATFFVLEKNCPIYPTQHIHYYTIAQQKSVDGFS